MSFSNFLDEDQRLVILKLLNELPSYTANGSVILKGLELLGHNISKDKLRTHLNWLKEQNLIELEILDIDLAVAKLTQRGLDVALGKANQPGVKKPRP